VGFSLANRCITDKLGLHEPETELRTIGEGWDTPKETSNWPTKHL